jgi:hypothetical protein
VDAPRLNAAYLPVPEGPSKNWFFSYNYSDLTLDGAHRTPAAWQANGAETAVRVSGGKTLRSVTLDTGIFADANPSDNAWTADKAGNR